MMKVTMFDTKKIKSMKKLKPSDIFEKQSVPFDGIAFSTPPNDERKKIIKLAKKVGTYMYKETHSSTKEKKLPIVCDIEFIADGKTECDVCGISAFSHVHKEGTLPKDYNIVFTPPQEAEKKEEINRVIPCSCNTITKPDGTDRQGVMCMKHVNELLQEQKEKVVEEIEKDIVGRMPLFVPKKTREMIEFFLTLIKPVFHKDSL